MSSSPDHAAAIPPCAWQLAVITSGVRYERIDQQQINMLTGRPFKGDYSTALPALNVLYRLDEGWNLYVNTKGSFGSVQYSQMPNRVRQGLVKPEKYKRKTLLRSL